MTWSMNWKGLAADFDTSLTTVVTGSRGRTGGIALDAAWEAAQQVATQDPEAHVQITGNGFDQLTEGKQFVGGLTIAVVVLGKPTELDKKLAAQAPVDLLRGTPAGDAPSGAGTPAASDSSPDA